MAILAAVAISFFRLVLAIKFWAFSLFIRASAIAWIALARARARILSK